MHEYSWYHWMKQSANAAMPIQRVIFLSVLRARSTDCPSEDVNSGLLPSINIVTVRIIALNHCRVNTTHPHTEHTHTHTHTHTHGLAYILYGHISSCILSRDLRNLRGDWKDYSGCFINHAFFTVVWRCCRGLESAWTLHSSQIFNRFLSLNHQPSVLFKVTAEIYAFLSLCYKFLQTTTKLPRSSFICVVDVCWRHTRDSYFVYLRLPLKYYMSFPTESSLAKHLIHRWPLQTSLCVTASSNAQRQDRHPTKALLHNDSERQTQPARQFNGPDRRSTSQSRRRAAMLIILAFIILFHLAAAILLFVATIHNVSIGQEGQKRTQKSMAMQEHLNHHCVPPWCRRGGWLHLPDVMWSTATCGTPVTPPAILWRTAILRKQVRQDVCAVCVKNICLIFFFCLLLSHVFLLCWGIICQIGIGVLNLKGSSTNLTYQNVLTDL